MIPRPAQYLLRFDDLCPTHDRDRWARFPPLIAEFGIRPILAVVPENADPELRTAEPDPAFWAQMRAMESAGATIGLHGYRHVCHNLGRSMVPLHSKSEFAGVPEAIQRQWIYDGLRKLQQNGLSPSIWVAPRHGFDRGTLNVLRAAGIGVLSDGFARRPFMRGGLTWIPQQLWAPVAMSSGLWTICMHPNSATDAQVARLRDFLRIHRDQFTCVERTLTGQAPTALGLVEQFHAATALWRIRGRKAWRSLLGNS